MSEIKIDLKRLADKWPSTFVSRSEIGRMTGGILSSSYLANLDCQGLGPPGRIKIGRKVAYPVAELVHWLETRSTKL